jgi:hypothetical protein
MLLQTNSYIVPREKRAAHAALLAQFRQALARLGCDLFEVYEQAGSDWQQAPSGGEGRFVQILRFRDRQHQLAVQAAERADASAQQMISRFCELINFPYQQEHGLFAVGFYIEMTPEPGPKSAAPEAQAPAGAAPVDVEAYIERELDEIMATFGDPRQLLQEAARGKPAASQTNAAPAQKPFPRLVQRDPSAPPGDDDLDSLLREQFTPAPGTHASDGSGSELGRVLDNGLAQDELDIPMLAELLDEDAMEGLDPRAPGPAAPKLPTGPVPPAARTTKR